MPPVAAKGRPAVYCKPACRKAAHEARRRQDPAAFEVKIVTTKTTVDHPLGTCVDNALASPKAFRRMLLELAALLDRDGLRDPRWYPIHSGLYELELAQARLQQRLEVERRERQARNAESAERLRIRQDEEIRKTYGLPPDHQF